MSRDFVGALLQLNAEKQVPREQLIHTVEDAIQSAYRRVAGDEDIHVRIEAESGRVTMRYPGIAGDPLLPDRRLVLERGRWRPLDA